MENRNRWKWIYIYTVGWVKLADVNIDWFAFHARNETANHLHEPFYSKAHFMMEKSLGRKEKQMIEKMLKWLDMASIPHSCENKTAERYDMGKPPTSSKIKLNEIYRIKFRFLLFQHSHIRTPIFTKMPFSFWWRIMNNGRDNIFFLSHSPSLSLYIYLARSFSVAVLRWYHDKWMANHSFINKSAHQTMPKFKIIHLSIS